MRSHQGLSGDPAYRELRRVASARRREVRDSELSAEDWLENRWRELNAVQRPARVDTDVTFYASAPEDRHITAWVPVHQITQGGFEARWGEVNNHPESFPAILRGLLDGSTRQWIDRIGVVSLRRFMGPNGPTYAVSLDGRHRVHVAKALDLPFLRASYADNRTWPSRGEEVNAPRENLEHMRLLGRMGILEDLRWTGSFRPGITGRLTSDFPTPWALEPPLSVWLFSTQYSKVYPEYASTPFYALTSSAKVAASLDYLVSIAPDPARARRAQRRSTIPLRLALRRSWHRVRPRHPLRDEAY